MAWLLPCAGELFWARYWGRGQSIRPGEEEVGEIVVVGVAKRGVIAVISSHRNSQVTLKLLWVNCNRKSTSIRGFFARGNLFAPMSRPGELLFRALEGSPRSPEISFSGRWWPLPSSARSWRIGSVPGRVGQLHSGKWQLQSSGKNHVSWKYMSIYFFNKVDLCDTLNLILKFYVLT